MNRLWIDFEQDRACPAGPHVSDAGRPLIGWNSDDSLGISFGQWHYSLQPIMLKRFRCLVAREPTEMVIGEAPIGIHQSERWSRLGRRTQVTVWLLLIPNDLFNTNLSRLRHDSAPWSPAKLKHKSVWLRHFNEQLVRTQKIGGRRATSGRRTTSMALNYLWWQWLDLGKEWYRPGFVWNG